MGNDGRTDPTADLPRHELKAAELQTLELPVATASFRRRAWLQFQRALDPFAPPKPLRPPRA